jgi:hypothetical protein
LSCHVPNPTAGIFAPVLSVKVVPLCAILTCCGLSCRVICDSLFVDVVRKEREADDASILTLFVLFKCTMLFS